MDDRDVLLRAIIDIPPDDFPRLVYAARLGKTGESELAELIRRQLRQAGDTDKPWTAILVCEVMEEIDRLLTDDPGRTLGCRLGRELALPQE